MDANFYYIVSQLFFSKNIYTQRRFDVSNYT